MLHRLAFPAVAAAALLLALTSPAPAAKPPPKTTTTRAATTTTQAATTTTLAPTTTTTGGSGTVTPLCANTAYVEEAAPTSNFGAALDLNIAGTTKLAFLECVVTGIPAEAQVTSATLNVFSRSVNTAHTIRLHNQPTSWVEGTVTWNSLHTYDAAILSSANGNLVAGAGEWVDLAAPTVTGNGAVRFALDTSTSSTQAYASDDYTTDPTRRPKLTVSWSSTGPTTTTTGETTTTVAPTTTIVMGGGQMPVGDLPGWRQIRTEDFNIPAAVGTWSTPDDASHIDYVGETGTKWRSYPQSYNDTEGRPYRGDQVLSVHDGMLDFFLHPVNGVAAGANPSPILDNTTNSQYQTYGRYSFRMRLDSTGMSDYKTAILLWPTGADEANWCQAESDYPEGNLIDTDVSAFHHNGCPDDQDSFSTPSFDRTAWHVFTQEWGPGFRRYYFDNTLIGTSTTNVYALPERWQFQVETRSTVTNNNQGHLLIDWAVVYEYAP